MNLNNTIDFKNIKSESKLIKWGEIKPLNSTCENNKNEYPINSFPITVRQAIIQAAFHNHVPLALAGQTALGLMVYVAQEHAQAPSDKTTRGQSCSIGIFSIFESGGGKDETRNLLARSILDIEKKAQEKYIIEKKAYYSLKTKDRSEALKPTCPTTLYRKGTIQGITKAMSQSELKSFAWQTTEGAMVLGGYSLTSDTMGESLGVINNLIDQGETSNTISSDDESYSVINKRFCVDLSIQDILAKKSLHNEILRQQGFLARFLFAAPPPMPFREVTLEQRRIIASEDIAIIKFNELLEHLKYPLHNKELDPHCNERTLFLKDDEAHKLHINFENFIKAEIRSEEEIKSDAETEVEANIHGKYYSIRPNALRMIQYSLRVATVLAYFTPNLTYIDAKTMQAAIDLCIYSLEQWINYYRDKEEEENECHLMLKWLLKQKSSHVLKSRISTHATPSKLRNRNTRDDVLRTLSDSNYINIEKVLGKDYVILNPKLL